MILSDNGGIYWLGSYVPAIGLSINSYLIVDEYPTLINTGAPVTTSTIIRNIRSIIRFEDLKYIVLNQAGVAYAGGLREIADMAPQARIVANEFEAIRLGLYGLFIQPLIIQEDDILSIGKNTLQFLPAPFIGSPNAIFVYNRENKVLFSGEAFSTTVSRWRTTTDEDMTELLEAYYNTHIGDSTIARDAIAQLKKLDLSHVAPVHGPVLQKHIQKYIDKLGAQIGEAA